MDEDELLMAEINAVANRADQNRDEPRDLKAVSRTLSLMFGHRPPAEIEDDAQMSGATGCSGAFSCTVSVPASAGRKAH